MLPLVVHYYAPKLCTMLFKQFSTIDWQHASAEQAQHHSYKLRWATLQVELLLKFIHRRLLAYSGQKALYILILIRKSLEHQLHRHISASQLLYPSSTHPSTEGAAECPPQPPRSKLAPWGKENSKSMARFSIVTKSNESLHGMQVALSSSLGSQKYWVPAVEASVSSMLAGAFMSHHVPHRQDVSSIAYCITAILYLDTKTNWVSRNSNFATCY